MIVAFPRGFAACILSGLLLSGLLGCASAPETARPTETVHPHEPSNFLWEVSGNGSTAYLAGSIHMLKESVYPLPNVFDSTFALSDRLVLEMNLDSLDMASVTSLLLSKGMFNDGRTLQEVLPDSVYQMAKKKLAGMEMDIAAMSRFRPWFVMFTISAVELQQSGFEAELGLDMYFLNKARKTGMAISGLETLEEQVRTFEAISDTAQVDVLYQALVEAVPIGEEMDMLLAAWQSGDTMRVQNFMMRELSDSPEALDALLVQRNKRWLPAIERYLSAGQPVFVVVGAAHLLGHKGLPALLRARGYRVRQL